MKLCYLLPDAKTVCGLKMASLTEMRAPNCSTSEQCCKGLYRNAQMAACPGKNMSDLWIKTVLDTQQVQTGFASQASAEGQLKGTMKLAYKLHANMHTSTCSY